MFNSLTLACAGQENDVITWKFSLNSDLTSNEDLIATYSVAGAGLSWLEVENTKQGYYQCQINSSPSYTVGVYDTYVTTGNVNFIYSSILRLIEPPVNRVKLVNRVTWQKTDHINSVNLLRLIGPTPLFRSIGSKLPGPDVTLLSGVYCI